MAVHERKGKKGITVWIYDFTLGGKRYRKTVGRNKQKAEKAERERWLEVEAGHSAPAAEANQKSLSQADDSRESCSPDSREFIEYLETRYLKWSELHKKSWRDDVYHAATLKRFFGDLHFNQITPELLDRFMAERIKTPTKSGRDRSPTSVNRELELISSIFSRAILDGVVESNPCKKVKKFAEDNERTRYLSPDEETRLLAQLVGEREHLRSIVLMAIHTGMRRNEILSLRWSEVDLERGVIHVIKTKSRRNRALPINEVVHRELAALQEQTDGAGGWVFRSTKTGSKFVDIKKGFTAACKASGISGLRFHDLRHTTGTRLGDDGTSTTTIAEILGHSDLRMTKRYTHATDPNKREAVERLARYGHQHGAGQKSVKNSERREG
jgi:integrase